MSFVVQRPVAASLTPRCVYNPRGDQLRGINRQSTPRLFPSSRRPESGTFYLSSRSSGWSLHSAVSQGMLKTDEGDGSGGGDGANKKQTGGDGSGDNEGKMSPEIVGLLASAGRTAQSFPEDFAQALLAGKVSKSILERYIKMEGSFFLRLLFGIAGFRERLLADPGFLFKVGVECGIGICTKSAAEYAKRQDSFWKELDFVTANVIMAILADFMLVWLPAPTLVYNRKVSNAPRLLRWFRSCPENAFQVVQKGTESFNFLQRTGSVLRNGTKLLGVGILCSAIGVASTNALLALRAAFDPTFKPQNPPQDVVKMAFGYGVYMATSSNLRYQIVAGILEQRGIEVLFKQNREICHFLSLILRTGNTFLGSLLWVDFCRITGLQKKQKVIQEED